MTPPSNLRSVEIPLMADENPEKRRPKRKQGKDAPMDLAPEQQAMDPLSGFPGAFPVNVDEPAHESTNGSDNGSLQPEMVKPAAPPVDEAVVRHLLFHKALTFEPETNERIGEYVRMVEESKEGEHVAIRDAFDRSIALALELVIQEHLDPWKIDLVQFSALYMKHAQEKQVDLVTAGRILLMAWTVLKLQSDELAEKAEKKDEAPQSLEWDAIPDWHIGDEAWDYNRLVAAMPKPPFDEPVRHNAPRKVTLMELVEAFEEIRHEAMLRQQVQAERENLKARMAENALSAVEGMVHRDDPEAEIQEVWELIQKLDAVPMPLSVLADGDSEEFVKAFNAVLFLANWGRVKIWQRGFPYGPVYIRRREGAISESNNGQKAMGGAS